MDILGLGSDTIHRLEVNVISGLGVPPCFIFYRVTCLNTGQSGEKTLKC